MVNKKTVALGLLISTIPGTTQNFPTIRFDFTPVILLNRKTFLIGGAVIGTVCAGVWLYNYFWVFTLPKAYELCHKVTEYSDDISNRYEREFALLERESNRDIQKAELQNIIADLDSESPYLTYTNTIKRDLLKAKKYEETFSRGIPHLEKAMEKCIKKTESASEEKLEKLQSEIREYKFILTKIAQLREIVHAIRRKLQRLVNYCVQYDAYKQEKILERLQAIESQLIYSRIDSRINR